MREDGWKSRALVRCIRMCCTIWDWILSVIWDSPLAAVCMMRRFAQPRGSGQRPLPYSLYCRRRRALPARLCETPGLCHRSHAIPRILAQNFCDPPLSSEALAHALTMAGLEVEALSTVAPPCSDVVVGRVLDVSRHPDADRLRVCTVDIGNGATLSIVCGAPNVAPGI